MKNIFQDLRRKDHKRYLGGLDVFKYIGPYPTGREILLSRALPYFTKCVESLVLLTCMKHILE